MNSDGLGLMDFHFGLSHYPTSLNIIGLPRSCCLAPFVLSPSYAQVYLAVPFFTVARRPIMCSHPWVVRLLSPHVTYQLDNNHVCAAAEVIYHQMQPSAHRVTIGAHGI
jgi:hypothetical protein